MGDGSLSNGEQLHIYIYIHVCWASGAQDSHLLLWYFSYRRAGGSMRGWVVGKGRTMRQGTERKRREILIFSPSEIHW